MINKILKYYFYKQWVELDPTEHYPTEQVESQASHTLLELGILFIAKQDRLHIFIFVKLLSAYLFASIKFFYFVLKKK